MKNSDLDYLNKLKQYTTNPRGQSQQLYRNYRNEGLSNYPHIQDYERMVAQQAAQRGAEQGLIREYETNKNKLIQDEEARFRAQSAENERLRQAQAEQQAKQQQAPLAEIMANIKNTPWLSKKVASAPVKVAATSAPAPVKTVPARKPRTLFTIDPNTPVEFHNIQQGNGSMARYSLPFSTYGANHPYMKLTGENINHGKWYDPNDGRYYNTQF